MLTASQIVNLACQDARKAGASGTGFSPQAGQKLNLILNELCILYDLEVNTKPGTVVLTGAPAGPAGFVGVMAGIGPYSLPADYLRMAQDELIYSYNGTPQKMVSDELSALDYLSLEPSTTNLPTRFATDINTIPPGLYVWPPPQSAITLNFRYSSLETDISSPETSASQPWMKLQTYLLARLTGEMLEPDQRADRFYAKAEKLLETYLESADDSLGRATIIKLDERNFHGSGAYDRLPRTKSNPF